MTTIAYDHKHKLIAIDGMTSAGGIIMNTSAIKYKENELGIWFFTGATSDCDQLMELRHNDKPEVKPDCAALLAKKDGSLWLVAFNGDYCSHSKLDCSHAIGSGFEFALSAMDFGKPADEAVSYAATRDCYTGGKISLFDVVKFEFIE